MLASLSTDKDFALLKMAIEIAGHIALSYYDKSPEVQRKQDGSLVSEADLAVNEFLRSQLMQDRDDYGWLSEESVLNADRLRRHKVWVIDPIDGTGAFLRHEPEWTISCALVVGNIPTYAVIYNPVTKELFDAACGHGARLNNTPIYVSEEENPNDSNIIISKKACNLFHSDRNLVTCRRKWVSSVAYRMCLLSAGRVDAAFVRSGAYDWDLAAAKLVVEEAGGLLTTFTGRHITFNKAEVRHPNIVASNNIMHDKLLKVCKGIEF